MKNRLKFLYFTFIFVFHNLTTMEPLLSPDSSNFSESSVNIEQSGLILAQLALKKQKKKMAKKNKGNTELIKAIINNSDNIDDLINDESINIPNKEGNFPLHYAIIYKNLDAAQKILEAGAKVDNKNKKGFTALYYALTDKLNADQILEDDLITLLLNHSAAHKLLNDETKRKILKLNLIHNIIDNYDEYDDDLYEEVKDAIKLGSDVNSQDIFQMTPLHRIIQFNNCSCDIVDLLLENGALAIIEDINGNVPLHHAADYEFSNDDKLDLEKELIIKKLINVDKSSLEIKNCLGNTPIFDVIETDILEILINAGANTQVKNNDGLTPLLMAVYSDNNSNANYLLDYSLNICKKTVSNIIADINLVLDKDKKNEYKILQNFKRNL